MRGVSRVGLLDMRAQAEVPSALRPDTPKQFGATRQTSCHLVVRAAERTAAIPCALAGGFPRKAKKADPFTPGAEPWSPPGFFRSWAWPWIGCIGFRPVWTPVTLDS
jgi:hypothetical protein